MSKITDYLNQKMVGNIYEKPSILSAYSSHSSILEAKPKFVAFPRNTKDVAILTNFVHQLALKKYQLPITIYGSGLDQTGGDIGRGLILSTEKLKVVPEVDIEGRMVRVSAGTTLEELQTILAVSGLTAKLQGKPKQTIGAIISTSTPTLGHNLLEIVEKLEVVLSNGEIIQVNKRSGLNHLKKPSKSSLEYRIRQEWPKLYQEFQAEIKILQQRMLRARGYQMVAMSFNSGGKEANLIPLFLGAQGTLGIVTEIILKCEVLKTGRQLIAIRLGNLKGVERLMDEVVVSQPRRADLMDLKIITGQSGGQKINWLEKRSGFLLLLDYNLNKLKLNWQVKRLKKMLPKNGELVVEDKKNSDEFKKIDMAFEEYLNDLGEQRPPILTDFYLPGEALYKFNLELKQLLEARGLEAPLFGSLVTGNYSIRPHFSLGAKRDQQLALRVMRELAELLMQHRGDLVGSTAEGRTKAVFSNLSFTKEEKALYLAIKKLFDPEEILNPEVKLGANVRGLVRDLKNEAHQGLIEY